MRENEIYSRLIVVTSQMRVHSFLGFMCLVLFIVEQVMLFLNFINFNFLYILTSSSFTLGFFENKKLFENYVEEYDNLQEDLKELFNKK
jgi:hypothetical protein